MESLDGFAQQAAGTSSKPCSMYFVRQHSVVEFHADLTFGVRLAPRWLLLIQSFNVLSEGSGTWGFSSYDYEKAQLSVVYAVSAALSLQVGGFSTYAGRNAIQENGLVLGAWHKF